MHYANFYGDNVNLLLSFCYPIQLTDADSSFNEIPDL
jgi:hypothetical protein